MKIDGIFWLREYFTASSCIQSLSAKARTPWLMPSNIIITTRKAHPDLCTSEPNAFKFFNRLAVGALHHFNAAATTMVLVFLQLGKVDPGVLIGNVSALLEHFLARRFRLARE